LDREPQYRLIDDTELMLTVWAARPDKENRDDERLWMHLLFFPEPTWWSSIRKWKRGADCGGVGFDATYNSIPWPKNLQPELARFPLRV